MEGTGNSGELPSKGSNQPFGNSGRIIDASQGIRDLGGTCRVARGNVSRSRWIPSGDRLAYSTNESTWKRRYAKGVPRGWNREFQRVRQEAKRNWDDRRCRDEAVKFHFENCSRWRRDARSRFSLFLRGWTCEDASFASCKWPEGKTAFAARKSFEEASKPWPIIGALTNWRLVNSLVSCHVLTKLTAWWIFSYRNGNLIWLRGLNSYDGRIFTLFRKRSDFILLQSIPCHGINLCRRRSL